MRFSSHVFGSKMMVASAFLHFFLQSLVERVTHILAFLMLVCNYSTVIPESFGADPKTKWHSIRSFTILFFFFQDPFSHSCTLRIFQFAIWAFSGEKLGMHAAMDVAQNVTCVFFFSLDCEEREIWHVVMTIGTS